MEKHKLEDVGGAQLLDAQAEVRRVMSESERTNALADAANLLGLSDQVPGRVEFLTDGTGLNPRTEARAPLHSRGRCLTCRTVMYKLLYT